MMSTLLELLVILSCADAGCGEFGGYKVRTNSMSPTIVKDDIVSIDRKAYASVGKVKRWDVVVITRSDGTGPPQMYVKRVVALPGETLAYSPEAVSINGKALKIPERYKFLKTLSSDSLPESKASVRVPKNAVFLVGDNIDASRDSRIDGPVRFKNLVGKVNKVNGRPFK